MHVVWGQRTPQREVARRFNASHCWRDYRCMLAWAHESGSDKESGRDEKQVRLVESRKISVCS